MKPTGGTQPDLFGAQEPRQHKRTRQTSRQVYRKRREMDRQLESHGRETSRGAVLRCLSAYWNYFQRSPTAYELWQWARARGERFRDVNAIRPRLTELIAEGLVEPRAKRPCGVTGTVAHTWAVREAGSREPR